MNLIDELDHIYSDYISEVQLINNFLMGAHKNIERKTSTIVKGLAEKDKLESKEILSKLLDQLTGETKDYGPITASKRVSRNLMNLIGGIRQNKFLPEMTLVYLISFYEAFVKDYLIAILTSRSEILRSKKTLTFEEAASFQSMDELLQHMAKKEVSDLEYDSVDDVAKYFNDKFHIDYVTDFSMWSIVREASYRRNVVIHNKGIADKIYCSKTGHENIGRPLDTNIDYVDAVCQAIIGFISFTHGQAKIKFVSANSTAPSKTQKTKPKP